MTAETNKNAISASVGKNGMNKSSDVIIIQKLLKSRKYNPGPIDGICGKLTIDSIKKFQSMFMAKPDGIIDPNGRTWKKLMSLNSFEAKLSLKEWEGDSSQWPLDKKLSSLHADLRLKVEAILDALRKRDFMPKIFYGWRSLEAQLEIYNKGNSKLKDFSLHNALKPNGTPQSYAADIIDQRYAWTSLAEKNGFWTALGEEAKKQQLYWGGDWKNPYDPAHVQLVPPTKAELRRIKKESGY
jgi:peptidoglycan hydrolase-like protein with peptidoglycan-binding domain